MKIKFTIQILLWGISLTAMTAPETLARHDQRILDREISIDVQNVPLAAALTEIEIAADVKFVYSGSQLDLDQPVTIAVRNKRLGLILNDLLGTIGIMYTVDREYILLKPVKAEIAKPVLTGEADATAEPFLAISGTVTDAATLQPIAGVNIIVKGTTSGTTTDSEGKYVIDAEEGDMLVFSFIGYRKMEVPVGGRMIIDVSLEEDVASLKEVVVNAGYYTVTDKTKTGNISKVTAKEIEQQPVTSPLMALQGRVAGLDIAPRTGTPGNAPSIRIRGQNSLRIDGGLPLYVVDGVIVDSKPLPSQGALMFGGFDPLSTLNTSNIESIEILKDADATAIYGSRGANGVILITTKQGSSNGDDMNIQIHTSHGVGDIPSRIDLLNTPEYVSMRKEAYANDLAALTEPLGDDLLLWDTTRYTDWQDVFLGGTATVTNAQLNISGGNRSISYRMGGAFYKETLVTPGDFGYKRATGNLSLNHTSRDLKFGVTVSVSYGSESNALFNSSNLVSSALSLPPNAPKLYNNDGSLNWELDTIGPGVFRHTWTNPLSLMMKTHESSAGNFLANSSLYYHLHPGFTLKTNIGYTDLNGQEFLKSPISVNPPNQISSSTRGSADFGTNKRTSWIIEPQVNYNLARRNYDLNVLAGLTFQESNSAFQRVSASGYTSDALIGSLQGATTLFQSDESTRYKYTAFFGRLGFTYKDRYLLNLTGRRDGSSRFGPGNRFGNFGAIGTAWIFSNEDFLANSLLSLGKLRASIGTTGNDQIGDYQYYNAYKVNFNTYQGSATLAPAALYNPDFGWEITKKLEGGIELGFFNDRVVMELSAYRNRSSNQLIQYRLPATTGFQSVLSNFNATIENSGIESMIKTINITSDNFTWSSSLNVSLPENKLMAFPDIEESSYAKQYKVGASLSVQRLYTWTGVDPITGYHTIKDTNEDGMLNDDDKTMMGSLDRKYYGGFNNVFRYKNLELTILLQFSKHNAFRYSSNAPGFRGNQLAEVLNRWQHEGDVTEVQKFSQSFFPAYINFAYASQSDFSIVDASFVRIKTFSLSFFIPEQLAAQLKMKDAKIYVQGQNLLTISNYVNLDPETGSQLPPLRMLIAGVQLNF